MHFDWVLAITAGVIARSISTHEREWVGCLAYCAVLLSPIVFLNSAAWAQCDAIYSDFALLAILHLERKQYTRAMCFLGVSFAFKLQAVFVLPIFLFVYFTVFCRPFFTCSLYDGDFVIANRPVGEEPD